eukprot:TRINITY_DN756_c1_g1_i2.p1 TRINITY_DN756_c1_g1~~TRINITY_DN756_c1_g1_i2.p1  ORF type:complete len:570 (-),score=129.53 TRINITY_DN756_c1_g1_i2:1856-3445(-)
MEEIQEDFINHMGTVEIIDRSKMILFDAVSGISVNATNVKMSVELGSLPWKKVTVPILHGISFKIPSGKLVGIMGGSGSGKTTLLNALAQRLEGAYKTEGSIQFNDKDPKLFENSMGYCLQSDQLMPNLTVRETLQYAAALRLPKKDRQKQVEGVIQELGLKECADTFIGSASVKGISGGEKRRVSVAIQLLTNPSLLFLDEPTTGLDAFSAFNLMQTLQSLASHGRTIIVSLHQPRSDIYRMLDSVILLSKGNCIYSGEAKKAFDYFSSIGYECPQMTNIAEYMLDISSIDNRTVEAEKKTQVQLENLVEKWKENSGNFQNQESLIETAKIQSNFAGRRQNYFSEILTLTSREFFNTSRERVPLISDIVATIFLAICVGGIWYQLEDDLAGIQSRTGLLYVVGVLRLYLVLLLGLYRYSYQLQVFDRERLDKMYSVPSFILGQFLGTFLFEIINPILYAVIVYYMAKLREDSFYYFLIFLSAEIISQMLVNSISLFCLSIHRSYAQASTIANMLFSFYGLSCGFFCTN